MWKPHDDDDDDDDDDDVFREFQEKKPRYLRSASAFSSIAVSRKESKERFVVGRDVQEEKGDKK